MTTLFMTDNMFDQQRRAAHDAFLTEARAAVMEILKHPVSNINASVRFTATEVVFTWSSGTPQVSDPAKVSDPPQASYPRASDADCDKMEQATRQHVSERGDEVATVIALSDEHVESAKHEDDVCAANCRLTLALDSLSIEDAFPRPTEDACTRLVSHLEKSDHIDYYSAANRVVARVPMVGWGATKSNARAMIREYHALRSSGDQCSILQEGALDPCVHDEPSCTRSPTPIDDSWGPISYVIRLDRDDGGVFTYNAMFKKPVQLICGHDIACYPRDVKREIRSFWRSGLGCHLCPHFLGDMRIYEPVT
jgi:hypothetical protein